MQLDSPQLGFPASFCCNCGDTNCVSEIQDTRVTRFFGIGGTETTFHLPVPVCAACRRSTRRRAPGFFARLLVLALAVGVLFLALLMFASIVTLPEWMARTCSASASVSRVLLMLLCSMLRRPKPPQTSFYQPVRIKDVRVQVTDVMNGDGQVAFMKLAFTNPDYLDVFVNANREAISAGSARGREGLRRRTRQAAKLVDSRRFRALTSARATRFNSDLVASGEAHGCARSSNKSFACDAARSHESRLSGSPR